jgi:AAA15 family ATPase/GTPase
MIVNFTVANFLSFKEKQVLSFVPEALKELKGHLHVPYLYDPRDTLLKSIAIYGHNSHGKSNFLKAYQFFQTFIFNSFYLSKTTSEIEILPFQLSTATLSKPSLFEITFLVGDTKYRYGFEVNSEKIFSEWLFYTQSKIRENNLFIRNGQEFQVSKSWNKEAQGKIDSQSIPFAKPSVLLLSVLLSQDEIPRIAPITSWLKNNIVIVNANDNQLLSIATKIYSDQVYKPIILKFIEKADLGFNTIFDKIDKTAKKSGKYDEGFLSLWFSDEIKRFELYTKHRVFDHEYKLKDEIEFELVKNESDGSIRFFIISCLLAYAIKNAQIMFIDELDSKLHPLLFEMLIKVYHDPKVNIAGSQMVFTTHSTVLLNKKLRRDQIVLVEKNQFGESSLRRLHSKETPIRIDTSIEKEYRKGELGGVSDKLKNTNPNLFDF